MVTLYFILTLGIWDRVRGSDLLHFSHFIGMLGMGGTVAVLLGLHGWAALAVTLTVMAGAAPGWGNPLGALFDRRQMGPDYEWWQGGVLRRNVHLAILARGILWAVPVAPFSPSAGIAFALAFVAAPYLALLIPKTSSIDRWALMGFTRGIIAGTIIAIIGG